jgi:peptidoglycan/LPS O-acetylase OafA/YrhL
MPGDSKPSRLNSLTSLRYVAAAAVVVTHINPYFVTSHTLVDGFTYWYVGVSFFFVLSGFVLTWSCSWQAPAAFWWNRFSRVWPLQAVMMISLYVFMWDTVYHPPNLLGWVLQPFLLQGWYPNQHVYAAGNGPTWSLSCECFFYAMFPLVIKGVRRLRMRGVVITASITIAIMVLAPAVAGTQMSAETSQTYLWLFFYLPAYRFGEFFIGMLLARAFQQGLRFRAPAFGYLLGWGWFAAWQVTVTLYTRWNHGYPIPRPFATVLVVPGIALLLLAGASADVSGRARLLGSRLPVLLGTWSFALYMVHDPFVNLTTQHRWLWHPGGLTGIVYMAIFVVICTIAGMIAHYALEKPVERWLRRLGPGKRRAADPSSRDASSGRHRRQQADPANVGTGRYLEPAPLESPEALRRSLGSPDSAAKAGDRLAGRGQPAISSGDKADSAATARRNASRSVSGSMASSRFSFAWISARTVPLTRWPAGAIDSSLARRSAGSGSRVMSPRSWSSSSVAMIRVLSAPIASASAACVRAGPSSSALSTT